MKLYEKKLFTIADYLMKVHEDKHYIEKVMNQFNSDFLSLENLFFQIFANYEIFAL